MKSSVSAGQVLQYPDGQAVKCLDQGKDAEGEFLIVEHTIIRKGAVNGPHWHPELRESFTIKQGTIRFKVDGKESVLQAGDHISVNAGQVHQFWKEGETPLVMIHEIRPPGLHWEMFALLHKLECGGKMNKKGIPRNPLWLGLAWESMDGYIAGPPVFMQKFLFGSLARLAKAFGYSSR